MSIRDDMIQKVLGNPGKYSIQELQTAMRSGSLPAYVVVPIIQDKVQQQKQMQAAMQQQQPPQSTVAEQVMQEADQMGGGVAQLPSNLPQEYSGGGIVAFGDGGEVERFQNKGLVSLGPGSGGLSEEEAAFIAEEEKKMRGEYGPTAPAATPFGRIFSGAGQISPEQADKLETDKLKKQLISQYAPKAGIRGWFAEQSDPQQKAAKDIVNTVNSMTLDQLRAAVAQPESVAAYQAALEAKPESTRTTGGASGSWGTPAPAGKPPAAGPGAAGPGAAGPGVGAPAGITGLEPSGVKRPYIKSAQDVVNEAYYGTETQPGFMARAEERDRKQDELIQAAEGKVTGKAYEGLEASLRKEAEAFGADKEQAKAMAIFKAGLAMMAGTSRHALENIGKGAMVGAEDYQKAAAELKKAQKENERMMAQVEQARRAEAMGDRDRAIARYEKIHALKESRDAHLTNASITAGLKEGDRAIELYKTDIDKETKLRLGQMHKEATLGAAQVRTEGRGEVTAANRIAAMNLLEKREQAIHQKTIAELGFKPDMKNPRHVAEYNKVLGQVRARELNDILRTMSGEVGEMPSGPAAGQPQVRYLGVQAPQ